MESLSGLQPVQTFLGQCQPLWLRVMKGYHEDPDRPRGDASAIVERNECVCHTSAGRRQLMRYPFDGAPKSFRREEEELHI